MSRPKGSQRRTLVNQVAKQPTFRSTLKGSGQRLMLYHPPYERDRVNRIFVERLVRHTQNFSRITWLGRPIWQNILDLWSVQEAIWEVKPQLLIECGTHRGGSAYFYAHLFDLMQKGKVITIDIVRPHDVNHPRIEFILGSSVDDLVVDRVRSAASSSTGPVMVSLDSDHTASHVGHELELYAPLVTRNSFILVQDGVIDTLPVFRDGRPGPLPAIKKFLRRHPEFEVDFERSERFLLSHHPLGWLKRRC